MEVSKDMYLEIAKASDDRTVLQMLAVNKKFNDPEFFRELIIRKYPVLFKFKKIDEDWKHFYLRIVKYIAKLRDEFDYTLSLDVDPEQFYKCKKLLNKMNKWRTQEVDYFDLYEAPNIFELLYNDEQNGNHDSVGSYIINQKTLAREDYMDELDKLSTVGMFGEASDLYELTEDLTIVDSLSDREELVYDYKLLLEVLKRNGKTFQEYENISGMSLEMVKNYPKMYAAKLSENPLMHDMKFLHDNIRRKTNALAKFLAEENDGASTYHMFGNSALFPSNLMEKERNYQTPVTYEELILTDEEIEFLLSIHKRILDPQDELTIISLVNCKDLI